MFFLLALSTFDFHYLYAPRIVTPVYPARSPPSCPVTDAARGTASAAAPAILFTHRFRTVPPRGARHPSAAGTAGRRAGGEPGVPASCSLPMPSSSVQQNEAHSRGRNGTRRTRLFDHHGRFVPTDRVADTVPHCTTQVPTSRAAAATQPSRPPPGMDPWSRTTRDADVNVCIIPRTAQDCQHGLDRLGWVEPSRHYLVASAQQRVQVCHRLCCSGTLEDPAWKKVSVPTTIDRWHGHRGDRWRLTPWLKNGSPGQTHLGRAGPDQIVYAQMMIE